MLTSPFALLTRPAPHVWPHRHPDAAVPHGEMANAQVQYLALICIADPFQSEHNVDGVVEAESLFNLDPDSEDNLRWAAVESDAVLVQVNGLRFN